MLRFLYRCVLRLHPPGFRARFADEMLSIFDQTAEDLAAFKLLGDGFASLARQWALRPEFWREPAPEKQPAADGSPCFYILDPFRPRAGAMIHGVVLSTAVFCLTCFAIRYSWIHILHVHIPAVQFERPRSMQPTAGTGGDALSEKPTIPPRSHDVTSISLSTSPHSSFNGKFKDRPRPAPSAVAMQNRPAATSGTHGSEMRTSETLASESREQSGLSSAPLGATPAPQGRLRPHVGLQVDTPQVAQSKRQGTSGATPRAVEDAKLDAAERHRVIDGAIANLTKYYIDPDAAGKMANTLLAHEKNGSYDAVMDGAAFADLLTAQMRDVSHDKYVTMVYRKVTTPGNPRSEPDPEDVARYRREVEKNNCAFEKVEILPHNIGYLKFNAFPDASICGTTAAAAMASLNRADAIIFDLRDNPGGYANMVAFIATYLFDHPAHLNDFYNRGENSTEQSWTLPPVPGNRLADKPAFVLTSHSTFSAAEGFSYDLKMLKRATLVGETTSGRGHMGMEHRIDDHFTIRVPGIRVVNPISKTNWEGTGVEPDVKVKAADALKAAERLAELRLQEK